MDCFILDSEMRYYLGEFASEFILDKTCNHAVKSGKGISSPGNRSETLEGEAGTFAQSILNIQRKPGFKWVLNPPF